MIPANIDQIRQRIARACDRCGRKPAELTLVAVTKTFAAGRIIEAIDAGVMDIGENYVQELLDKKERISRDAVRWHFIGHLQSNKAKYIASWIHLVHTLDNVRLARELDRRAAEARRQLDVLVEVNTTGESSKFGVEPDQAAGFVGSLAEFGHLRINGLMTIGPFLPDPEGSRPMFRRLRELRDEIAGLEQGNAPMQELSMGMSGDFEVAIEEGATLLRIGTAIFGSRKRPPAEGEQHETHTA